MISAKIIAKGDRFTICEIERNGISTLKKFFQNLTPEQRVGITSAIWYIAHHGPPIRQDKFNSEGDKIYAIKDESVRIYCFFDKDSLILLTNGVIKKKRKADPTDLKRAKKIRQLFLDARSQP